MRIALHIALLSSILVASACPPVGPYGRDVGAPCETDRDCTDRCDEHDSFGDGMCTLDCDDDRDCPNGTICIAHKGGTCAVSCDVDGDCQGFQQDFECKDAITADLDVEEVCLAD